MGTVYNANIVRNGLVLHLDAANKKSYSVNETIWKDLSGKNRDGTLVNGVGYSSEMSGTLVFEATDDYISIPHDSEISAQVFGTSTNFTLSCWVNTTTFQNWSCMIGKMFGASYSNSTVGIWCNATGYQVVAGSNENSNPAGSYIILSLTAQTNTWYNISAVGDGSNLLFYSNGELVTSASFTGITRTRTENTSPIIIGRRIISTGPSHTGKISNISVYNRGLSIDEIQQNFNALRGRYEI